MKKMREMKHWEQLLLVRIWLGNRKILKRQDNIWTKFQNIHQNLTDYQMN